MLKIHPIYMIYDIGFDNTVKNLLRKGFINYVDVPNLSTSYYLSDAGYYDEMVNDGTMSTIDKIKDKYEQEQIFIQTYKEIIAQAEDFVVTVCKKVYGELVPVGFVYM